MKKRFGHNIVKLENELRISLRSRTQHGRSPQYLLKLLSSIEDDTVWSRILNVLASYASEGRYYFLDSLAKSDLNATKNPRSLWEEMDTEVGDEYFTLEVARMFPESGAWDRARRDLNEYIAASVRRWWNMIYEFWHSGALGEWPATMAIQIRPQ